MEKIDRPHAAPAFTPAAHSLRGIEEVWQLDGAGPLAAAPVAADSLPPLARHLLDHTETMTARLAAHHGAALEIEVLGREHGRDVLERKIRMTVEEADVTAQVAVIRIMLSRLPADWHGAILEGTRPFGALLADMRLEFTSRPEAFLRVEATADLARQFRADAGTGDIVLYGRRNTIRDATGAVLAETIEVLPGA